MTALGEGDQVLATFLKGLELYQAAQLDRAAMQFQNSMQMAPTFAPSRLFLGAVARGSQSPQGSGGPAAKRSRPRRRMRAIARIAGEEWIKAGQPRARDHAARARGAAAERRSARRRKLLGIAYVLGGRGGGRRGRADAVPRGEPDRQRGAARRDLRHLLRGTSTAPQPATLAADRANIAKWSKAYAATKGPMQPLVEAWVEHVQGLK